MPRSRLQRSVLATVTQVVDDGFQGPVKNQAIVQHADQTGLHGCRQFFPLILGHLGTTAVHEDVLAGSLDKRCQLATQAGVVVALELYPGTNPHLIRPGKPFRIYGSFGLWLWFWRNFWLGHRLRSQGNFWLGLDSRLRF